MKKILLNAIGKYKLAIILAIIFIVLNIYILTLPSKIIGNIIDLFGNLEKNVDSITRYTYYLLASVTIALFTKVIARILSIYNARSIERQIKNKVFEHFTRMKMTNIQNIKNGELMSYLVKDSNEIRGGILRIFFITRGLSTLVITGIAMAKGVDFKLTIITFTPMIITAFAMIIITKHIEKNFKISQNYFTDLSEYVQESTDAIETTKAYSQEFYQLKNFMKKNKKLNNINNKVDIFSTLLSITMNIGFGLCYSVALIFGSKLVLENQITIGEFVEFNGYIALFVKPIRAIPTIISRLKRAKISYGRLDRFLSFEKEKIDISTDNISEKLNGDICIEDLTFNYPETVDMVLENINLKIKKGETLGIIGKVGSGKTTLLNLLIRLYPVKPGKIFIDGRDINNIPIEVIRENVAYITQENFLFSTTLKQNINLFREEYDIESIKNSTKNAMIYDEINDMPQTIETNLGGEDGIELSGGQKQRIAVSRAFLKKSSIVLFDDTFSALDNKTEKEVLKNIKELTKDKTCIIVSNRISDIKHSDKIIVLDTGKIIETGTHKELLNQKGSYYKFYMQQITKSKGGDFLDEEQSVV